MRRFGIKLLKLFSFFAIIIIFFACIPALILDVPIWLFGLSKKYGMIFDFLVYLETKLFEFMFNPIL